jgi:hypothetical protein
LTVVDERSANNKSRFSQHSSPTSDFARNSGSPTHPSSFSLCPSSSSLPDAPAVPPPPSKPSRRRAPRVPDVQSKSTRRDWLRRPVGARALEPRHWGGCSGKGENRRPTWGRRWVMEVRGGREMRARGGDFRRICEGASSSQKCAERKVPTW